MPDASSRPGGRFEDPSIPRSWGFVSLILLLAIVFGPPVAAIGFAGIAFWIVAAGAWTWALAVLVKRFLASCLNRLRPNTSDSGLALLQGGLSAGLELGAAGLFLARSPHWTIGEVLAFASAAGSAEAVYVLILGATTKRDPAKEAAWARGGRQSICVRYQVPLERFSALIGHTGSRGLVYLGLRDATRFGFLLIVIAVALFTAVDSVAYFGHLRRWDWLEPRTCRKVHGFFFAVSGAELVFFAVFR
jgi:hypothetical protein